MAKKLQILGSIDADTLGGIPAEDMASKAFVTNKIAEAQLGGDSEDIDLSGYATKDELDSHTHTIANIANLQTQLDSKVDLSSNQTVGGNKVFTGTTSTMILHTYNPLYINNGADNSKSTALYTNDSNVFAVTSSANDMTFNGESVALASDISSLQTQLNTKATKDELESIDFPVDSVNGKTGAVSLSAADVSAVPTTRTVNGKALSSNISLSASDVGAAASGHTHSGITTSVGDGGTMSIGYETNTSDGYNYYFRPQTPTDSNSYSLGSSQKPWNGGHIGCATITGAGATLLGDVIIGSNTDTDYKDLYIRRLVNDIPKSCRMLWNDNGQFRIQAASNGTTFCSLQLQDDRIIASQPLHVPGGAFTGNVDIGATDNTTQRNLYINRLVSDAVKTAQMYWNSNGAFEISASSDGSQFNYLRFNTNNTALGQPLAVGSGGTGATTAANARANIGAFSTSGGTINGDVYLGSETNTEAYDLYIRRVVSDVLKSCRLYWNGGNLRLQAASAGSVVNYLQLNEDETIINQPLSAPSGTFTGNVTIGAEDATNQRALYIKRLVNDVAKSGSLYWNSGSFRLQASSGSTRFNYLQLNENNTTLEKPLTVSSGGTGANNAADARTNLGLDRLYTIPYDSTTTAKSGLNIIKTKFSSLTTDNTVIFSYNNNGAFTTFIGAKYSDTYGYFFMFSINGLYMYKNNNGTWSEKTIVTW